MVRNYKRKTDRGQCYSKDDLLRAVDEVKSGRCNAYRASKMFKIPLNTILDHVKGRRGLKSNSYGRPTALSYDTEIKIAEGLRSMEKYGFGLSRKEVMALVGDYVAKNNLKTPFKDSQPNKDWLSLFMKRHKLSVKKPQSVEIARRKCCDPFIIYNYFKLLGDTIKGLGLEDKPHLIFNCDETSFCRDPSKTKVVGARGSASTRTTSTSGKDNITVLLTISASGDKLPPLIIFKGKNIWDQWSAPEGTGYPETSYAATSNGWMETEVFENYFQTTLLKAVATERPPLLICDGHATHVGLKLIEMARNEKITILKLPPHSSHLLQPLDLCVMKSLKVAWDEELIKWQRRHVGMKLPKNEFAKIVVEIWTKTNTSLIQKSFQKAGICPLNEKVIEEHLFDPSALRRWKESQTNLATITSESPILQVATPDVNLSTVSSNNGVDVPLTSTATTATSVDVKDLQVKSTVSFEELLLSTVKSHSSGEKQKKIRIATGSEVITSDEVFQRVQNIQNERKIANEQKIKNKKQKENRTVKAQSKKPRKTTVPEASDTTSDDDDAFSIQSSEIEDLENCLENEVREFQELETAFKDVSEMQIHDWVIVKFCPKKIAKHFVGQILSFECDEPVIHYARKISENTFSTTFRFPEVEDTGAADRADIVSILPPPTVGRRGGLTFQVTFSQYNMN